MHLEEVTERQTAREGEGETREARGKVGKV